MTLRSSELQSDGDLDSIRNSCDVFTGPALKVLSMELVPPNEEPSLRWSPSPHLLWQRVISSSSLGLYIELEKNILRVA